MKIIPLDTGRLPHFLEYCRRHRSEVDESFLSDEDLTGFYPDTENPTVIVLDEAGKIAGAGSIIADDYMRRGNRARARILHAENGDAEAYAGMLRALLPQLAGLGNLYAYAPDRNKAQLDVFARIGFTVDRYSIVMVREGQPVPEISLPEGFTIGPFAAGRDEQPWCDVRNAALSTLRGNETPITAQMAAELLSGEGSLEGGALILRHGGEPVGVVRVSRDMLSNEPVAEIGPLAVTPLWQGRGLGRCLLRSALRVAADRGLVKCVLCVNAENLRALGLYEREGFRKEEVAVCYVYRLQR